MTTDTGTANVGGLSVEYFVETRRRWGMSLRADGRTEEWSDAGGWQPLVQVPVTEVVAFADLVRASGFFELPATIEGDGTEDGTLLSWAIELDGRRHEVAAREAGTTQNPVLRALDAELQRIVGEALNREADAAEATEPDATEPDATEPDATEPDATEPA